MDLSRRNLLLASGAATLFGRSAASRAAAGRPKNFVLVFANGGWDVTYCLDPKQGALTPKGQPTPIEGPWLDAGSSAPQAEEVVQFGNLQIQNNEVLRGNAAQFFADWGARSHIVNGIWTGSIAHAPCRIRLFTGGTNQLNPDSATIFGYETAAVEPLGTVDLSGLSFPGPLAASTGRIGFQSQIVALIGSDSQWPDPDGALGPYPWFRASSCDVAAACEQRGIDAYLAKRAAAFGALRADGGANDARIAGLLESTDRARRFKQSADVLSESLVLGQTPSFELQCRMAVDMFASDLCRSVVLGTGSDWDTHIANTAQHGFYQNLFAGLGTLASELTAQGMFEDTLVVVMSEMTRTPQFNASNGKDHHSHTSAMLFGGGVRGDATSGATDNEDLESEPMNLATGVVDPDGELCKYDNFTAGILTMLGVDSRDWLPGVAPFTGAMR